MSARFGFVIRMASVLLTPCAVLGCRTGACERTPDGVRLVRDGKTVWSYVAEGEKPYVHPLALPDGSVATTARDIDHPWHRGLWFSWKYLNGVNFWEEDAAGRAKGVQRVRSTAVDDTGTNVIVTQEIDWGPREEPGRTFLREHREISFWTPAPDGSYAIVWRGRFTAVERTTIERTPPKQRADGRWSGGYAGFSLRLADGGAFDIRTRSGATAQPDVVARERDWIDYVKTSTGEGVRLEILKAPGRRVFYHWSDHRFTNLSPVFDAPLVLEPGETLELAYRATVHAAMR